MKDLIERLEKATGPDREIDRLIFDQFRPAEISEFDTPPLYTLYIDTALTLVPEFEGPYRGVWWKIEQTGGSFRSGKCFYIARVYGVSGTCEADAADWSFTGMGDAPIALCIAALKAAKHCRTSPRASSDQP